MTAPKAIDEARLRELWLAGVTCKAIAAEMGCSHALVSKRALSLSMPRRTTDPALLPTRKIVAAYRDHGMTLDAIRDDLRKQFPLISVTGIRNLLVAHGVQLRPRAYRKHPTGDTHGAECVRLARQGVPYSKIGAQLGLTVRQVAGRVRKVLPPIPTGRWARYDRDAILAAYAEHGSYHAAGREVGCHWSCVRYHVARRRGGAA